MKKITIPIGKLYDFEEKADFKKWLLEEMNKAHFDLNKRIDWRERCWYEKEFEGARPEDVDPLTSHDIIYYQKIDADDIEGDNYTIPRKIENCWDGIRL